MVRLVENSALIYDSSGLTRISRKQLTGTGSVCCTVHGTAKLKDIRQQIE